MERFIDTLFSLLIILVFIILPIITNLLRKKKKSEKGNGILERIITYYQEIYDNKKSAYPGEPIQKKKIKTKLKNVENKYRESEKEFKHLYDENSQGMPSSVGSPGIKELKSKNNMEQTYKRTAGLDKINKLPGLQKAVLYAEILGKPKALKEENRDVFGW